jgi:hypothetical protein
MKNNKLVILTCRNKFFGQTRKPWSSIDVQKMMDILQENGFEVEQYDFHEVYNNKIDIKDKTVFYSFSQKENYRQYIKDVVYWLSKHNEIIPSYDLLKCHENKGYQEIFKREIGLNGLSTGYFTSHKEVDFSAQKYPIVLKTSSGTNGKGVFLVKSIDGFKKFFHQLEKPFSLATQLDFFRRKYFRKKKFADYPEFSDQRDLVEYKEYLRLEKNFILQEFVPELSFDYRVLIAHDRYYVMRRSVKKGDFRASGSKIFSFSTIPDRGLLDFSKAIYNKFQTPFLSIDVLFNGKEYFMVEFQALHFGMSVVSKSTGFFSFNTENQWIFMEQKPHITDFFARTMVSYLKELNH